MKSSLKKYMTTLFFLLIVTLNIYAVTKESSISLDQAKVIASVKNAKKLMDTYGKKKAIQMFKKSSQNIFVADYQGNFFLSLLHPEMEATNQYNYKDSSGILVVQEEIAKAKAGGGSWQSHDNM